MLQAHRESTERWIDRYSEGCETMLEIRNSIHRLQMQYNSVSAEHIVLNEAYNEVNELISKFHKRGKNNAS